jgi:steroid delta-isomerase-like uncharacterized protein
VTRITRKRWKIKSTENDQLGFQCSVMTLGRRSRRCGGLAVRDERTVTMANSSNELTCYPAIYFEAWNRQDLDFAVTAVAENLTWRDPLLPEPLTTREQARTFFEFGWAVFPDLKFEALGSPLIDESNRTVVQEWIMRGSDSGTGFAPGAPPTGRSFEVPGADVWVLDADGVATSVIAYWDSALLTRQISPATGEDEIGSTGR